MQWILRLLLRPPFGSVKKFKLWVRAGKLRRRNACKLEYYIPCMRQHSQYDDILPPERPERRLLFGRREHLQNPAKFWAKEWRLRKMLRWLTIEHPEHARKRKFMAFFFFFGLLVNCLRTRAQSKLSEDKTERFGMRKEQNKTAGVFKLITNGSQRRCSGFVSGLPFKLNAEILETWKQANKLAGWKFEAENADRILCQAAGGAERDPVGVCDAIFRSLKNTILAGSVK